MSLEFYSPPGLLGVQVGRLATRQPLNLCLLAPVFQPFSLVQDHDGSNVDSVFLLMDTSLDGYLHRLEVEPPFTPASGIDG